MESRINFLIEKNDDHPILADLFLCDKESAPIVVYCHGFKGFKDWGHLPYIPKYFTENGLHFLKFNFSHNGTSPENPTDFVDLEAFGQNNYSIELEDVQVVLNFLNTSQNKDRERILHDQIYLMGHSRGGSIAILTAASDSRIKKLVTWAAVSDFARRFPGGKTLSKWKESGVMHIENFRTKQHLPHYYQFYQDFIQNRDKLDISNAEKSLQIPHLLIHGTKDESVFLGEALHLMSLNENTSLIKINNSTHTFGAHHPYKEKELPAAILQALDYTLTFLSDQ